MKRKKEENIVDPAKLLTARQEQIIRRQIRRNSQTIDWLIDKIDLVVNKERHPKDSNVLARFRKRLSISIEENDNFRTVLWSHLQAAQEWRRMPEEALDPVTFLVRSIRSRQSARIAEMCMK